jgi:hypothetical protein
VSENQPLILTYGADAKALDAAMDKSLSKVLRTMDAMDARVSKFEKHLSGMGRSGGAGKVSSEVNSIADAFGRLNGVEAGSAKLRMFGSALEPLGPVGMGAAAGIIAFAAAMDMAAKAAEWAEELKGVADRLGETTENVQKWDYAATASGVPIQSMRDGLQGLNEVLGKVQDNLTRSKNSLQVKAFGALGLTPADLKNYQSASELLPVIADRIRQVRTAAEQAAILKNLGIEQLAPLLKQGGDAVRGFTKAAQDSGAVVSGEVVVHMAKLNDDMKTADLRFSAASHTIGAEFVPALVAIKNAAADAMTWVAKLIDSMPSEDNAAGFKQEMLNGVHARARAHAVQSGDALAIYAAGGALSEVIDPVARSNMVSRLAGDASHAFAHAKEIAQRRSNAAGEQPNPTGNAPDLPPTGGKTHETGEHNARAAWEALKAYDEALIKAAKSLDAEHAARLQLIADTKKAAIDEAEKDKSLKPATRAMVETTAGMTFDADTAAENERYQKQASEHAKAVGDEISKYLEQQLQAQADIAGTLDARQKAERQRLLDEQAQARDDLGEKLRTDKAYQTPAGQLEAYNLMIAQIAAQQAELAAQHADDLKAKDAQESELREQTLRSEERSARAAEAVAKTNRQREAAALHLIDLQEQRELDDLKQTATTKRWSPQQVAPLKKSIEDDYDAQRADVRQRYASPFDQWAASGSKDIADVGNALESQAVKGIDDFNKGLGEAIANGKSFHETFRNILKQMEAELIEYLLKQAEIGVFNAAFGRGGDAAAAAVPGGSNKTKPGLAGAGSSIGSLFSIFGGSGGSAGQVARGPAQQPSASPMGTMAKLIGFGGTVLKILGLEGGGRVPGVGNHDSVPALLTPGERVIPKHASAAYAPFLDSLIAGRGLPGFAAGGVVGGSVGHIPVMHGMGSRSVALHLHNSWQLNGSGDESVQRMIGAANQQMGAQVVDIVRRSMPGWLAIDRAQSG